LRRGPSRLERGDVRVKMNAMKETHIELHKASEVMEDISNGGLTMNVLAHTWACAVGLSVNETNRSGKLLGREQGSGEKNLLVGVRKACNHRSEGGPGRKAQLVWGGKTAKHI